MTTVSDLIERARTTMEEIQDFRGIYKFVLDGDDARTFIVDATDDPKVIDGDGDAQVTIYMAAKDFIRLVEGKADRRALFFMGKITVEGDWGLAMKLKSLDEMLGDRGR
jgi:putative sterol carrier protein